MNQQYSEQITLTVVNKASAPIKEVVGNLRSMVATVAGMAGLGAGLGALVKTGLDFNRTMEDTKGGIAGVLLMTRQYANEAGKVVTGQAAMNAAFAEASVVQEKLKKDALGTAASYTELVGAFQSSVGPATAAGVESLDDIREITVMATQAMSALGIPTAQAAQELRGLFAGDMGPDNRLNQVLRVTKADLAAVAGDAEKTAKLFRDRLGPAASVAAMQTGSLTVRLSNLGDILDQTMGKATAGVFVDISSGVSDLIGWIEQVGPRAEAAGTAIWTSFKAALGPIEEVGRAAFAALDARVEESGGTWSEVLQGFAIVFNNVAYFVRVGWGALMNAMLHPLDALRTVFGSMLHGILQSVSGAASALGFDDLAARIRSAANAVDEWGSKENKWLTETAASEDRALEAWRANEASILAIGAATAKVAGDPKSNPKNLLDGASGAALHFGAVWTAESAKASAALGKFTREFAGFTGDTFGEAVAKIEDEYRDLVGQLGQLMFQAKVPFARGLAMLEELAEEKGRKITAAVFNGEAAAEDFISIFEARLTKDDAKMGASVGLAAAFDAIPGAAESAASAVRDVWANMAQSFDSLFFNVLSGRIDSLKDVFKSFGESLLQTFSAYLSDMVQRWIMAQTKMGQTGYTGKAFSSVSYGPNGEVTSLGAGTSSGGFSLGESTGWGSMGAGYANGGGWGGALSGAGVGLGVGSVVGQFGGGKYNQTGGQIGGMIGGAIFGVVGALVGAILGTLIGAAVSPNTEKHIKSSLSNIVPGTYQSWRAGSRDPETGERTPGSWQTITTQPRTSFERESYKVVQSQTATMADLFQTGAKEQARDLLASYTDAFRAAVKGGHVDIAAGSDEDLQKDYEYFLGTMLPRMGVSAAFGQTGYMPHGNRDKSGGVQGIDWWAPGMDKEGNWIEKQLYDPEAAIPKMLAGLGFTADKIGELAGRISTEAPDELLAYLTGMVSVVVGLRDLGLEMAKSFDQLSEGWADQAAEGPLAAFKSSATDLVTLFENLSLYSGDEQLQKAQEAQSASADFWSSVVEYLKDVKAAMDEMSASITAQRVAMREFLRPESEGAQVSRLWGDVTGVWGKLASAVDPSAVQEIVADTQTSIDAIFSIMAERVTRGKALVERMTGLRGNLWDIGKDVSSDALATANPLAAWGGDLADVQRQIAEAARLSGTEQIAAIEEVATSAETLYGNLRSLLSEIASVSASLATSFEKQIWELGVGEMDATGQASAVTDRIKLLQEQLKVATSPSEIQAIASEIQSLTTRYVGTFGEDDTKRAEAVAWAQEQLARANGLAQEALAALKAQAEAQAQALSATLSGATTLISDNVTAAATLIGQLSFTLGELERVMRETMGKLGQDLLDSLGPLRDAMTAAAGIFTGAVASSGVALTAPDTGFEARITSSTAALGTFEGALLRLASKMDEVSGSGPTETTTPPPTGRVTARDVIPLVRRYAGAMDPRVA